jgi:predicted ATPase
MLTSITFKSGSSPDEKPLHLELSPVTIFVGPNNSGKSRALLEIEEFCTLEKNEPNKILERVEYFKWSEEGFNAALMEVKSEPLLGEVLHKDHIYISRLKPQSNAMKRSLVHLKTAIAEAMNPNVSLSQYNHYLSLFTLRLNGKNRLSLTDEQLTGDLQQPPTSILGKLFLNNNLREEIRRIVFDAFGQYLVVDPTYMGQFRLRLSPRPPVDEREEKGWDDASVKFHANASEISEASDGVKAFVGMLTTLIAGEPKISLIDEPEAFLHPALCAKLGKELTKALSDTDRRLFVSTHSAAFLMGCVQSGVPLNIVRLTYDYKVATSRLLATSKLTPLMRNPLLRSAGVLNALFYSAVVVTEADADRAFYQEINERLLQAGDPRGIDGCLFLNAQNKQTIWDIVRPLRELGIPCAGIADIDIIKEGGAVWQKPMMGAFVPALSHPAMATERDSLLKAFNATQKNFKREGGINVLPPEEKQACVDFFDKLATYGIFVVPTGEIESWLPQLGIGTNKNTWLTSIFEAMGEDPISDGYIKPSEGDVWSFLGAVKVWTSNPQRRGIPD